MSKGEVRRDQRRAARRVLKNVANDIGNMSGRIIGRINYGTGVGRRQFAKNEDQIPSNEKDTVDE